MKSRLIFIRRNIEFNSIITKAYKKNLFIEPMYMFNLNHHVMNKDLYRDFLIND